MSNAPRLYSPQGMIGLEAVEREADAATAKYGANIESAAAVLAQKLATVPELRQTAARVFVLASVQHKAWEGVQ